MAVDAYQMKEGDPVTIIGYSAYEISSQDSYGSNLLCVKADGSLIELDICQVIVNTNFLNAASRD